MYRASREGGKVILHRGYEYYGHGGSPVATYWTCTQYSALNCPARLHIKIPSGVIILKKEHNHPPQARKKSGSIKKEAYELDFTVQAESKPRVASQSRDIASSSQNIIYLDDDEDDKQKYEEDDLKPHIASFSPKAESSPRAAISTPNTASSSSDIIYIDEEEADTHHVSVLKSAAKIKTPLLADVFIDEENAFKSAAASSRNTLVVHALAAPLKPLIEFRNDKKIDNKSQRAANEIKEDLTGNAVVVEDDAYQELEAENTKGTSDEDETNEEEMRLYANRKRMASAAREESNSANESEFSFDGINQYPGQLPKDNGESASTSKRKRTKICSTRKARGANITRKRQMNTVDVAPTEIRCALTCALANTSAKAKTTSQGDGVHFHVLESSTKTASSNSHHSTNWDDVLVTSALPFRQASDFDNASGERAKDKSAAATLTKLFIKTLSNSFSDFSSSSFSTAMQIVLFFQLFLQRIFLLHLLLLSFSNPILVQCPIPGQCLVDSPFGHFPLILMSRLRVASPFCRAIPADAEHRFVGLRPCRHCHFLLLHHHRHPPGAKFAFPIGIFLPFFFFYWLCVF